MGGVREVERRRTACVPRIPRLVVFAAALAAAWSLGRPAGAQVRRPSEGVSVMFIGMAGVVLSTATREVIVDGLFEKYEGPGPSPVADSTRAALREGRGRFANVDLLLVTHAHWDHFRAADVAEHLRANPRARLPRPPKVIVHLREDTAGSRLSSDRSLARRMRRATSRREIVQGVGIAVLGIPHTGGLLSRHIEHLGYVIELGGRRVLHLGDADVDEDVFAELDLGSRRIDVALVPQWMATSAEGRRIIERWIRPAQVVVIHFLQDDEHARAARTALPAARTLVRLLETHHW